MMIEENIENLFVRVARLERSTCCDNHQFEEIRSTKKDESMYFKYCIKCGIAFQIDGDMKKCISMDEIDIYFSTWRSWFIPSLFDKEKFQKNFDILKERYGDVL
jgi:hypothetical protein